MPATSSPEKREEMNIPTASMAAAKSINTKSAQYEERRLTSPYSDITNG